MVEGVQDRQSPRLDLGVPAPQLGERGHGEGDVGGWRPLEEDQLVASPARSHAEEGRAGPVVGVGRMADIPHPEEVLVEPGEFQRVLGGQADMIEAGELGHGLPPVRYARLAVRLSIG